MLSVDSTCKPRSFLFLSFWPPLRINLWSNFYKRYCGFLRVLFGSILSRGEILIRLLFTCGDKGGIEGIMSWMCVYRGAGAVIGLPLRDGMVTR